ncbi:tRNA-specific adenosine deaminase [Pseudomonas solani]|uniref:tRNA-specific adenosine deaminase n=1 Tax=Pseudomonas solani TaxID=2731552 RepID=A0ABN6BYN3_9PSED|nr:deaminase [Pseudomonas solani]BCD88260.1 tRNA-specific adenosine deaminase [Pseudomonas solani]
MTDDQAFLQRAVELARANVERGGRPFGALLAMRAASQSLGPRLEGCVIYASGQPCPMCLAAMHLSGVSRAVFAIANEEGEPFGLSTAAIYQQMALPLAQQRLPVRHLPQAGATALYQRWKDLHAQG